MYMKSQKISRGVVVKDIVTKDTGYAMAKCESLNGSVQWSVKPDGFDRSGNPRESNWIDEAQLEVAEGFLHLHSKPPAQTKITPGDWVEHFCGFTGVVVEKITYFNGCVSLGIQPTTCKREELPELKYVSSAYVTLIPCMDRVVSNDQPHKGGPSCKAPH